MKKVLFFILPSACAVLMTLSGYWLGLYQASRPFAAQIAHYEKTETLGRILGDAEIARELNETQKNDYYLAYHDGETVKNSAADISWGVKNVPAPFVGAAPWPGKNHNAFIDPLLFRTDKPLLEPKPAGVFRIFITGGSTAYGAGAPDQDRTIGAYLEHFLNQRRNRNTVSAPGFEVFTLANPSWASTHERIIIANRLSELEPDLVISISGFNDIHWGYAGRDILWFNTYADDYLRRLVGAAYEAAFRPPPPEVVEVGDGPVAPATVAARLSKNVQLSAHALALGQIDYLFVLQPSLLVTKKSLTVRERAFIDDRKAYFVKSYQLIDSRLRALALSNFGYLDLTSLFDKLSGDNDIFLDASHFGDKGNRLIAAAVAEHFVVDK